MDTFFAILNHIKGTGVFIKIFFESDFDRGECQLSDFFSNCKNIIPSQSYCWSKVSVQLHCMHDFQTRLLKMTFNIINLLLQFLSNRSKTFRICSGGHLEKIDLAKF